MQVQMQESLLPNPPFPRSLIVDNVPSMIHWVSIPARANYLIHREKFSFIRMPGAYHTHEATSHETGGVLPLLLTTPNYPPPERLAFFEYVYSHTNVRMIVPQHNQTG
ncbi:hypothetical protein PNOK_0902200 [Pyrrhoderma noxium]|uniref:Uncharacterized protein n=1 Tax=Pyrrhoderma noxium TaxID=2282107 RepID=A0A286U6Q7_9AGAM|nr:hypothetical protein PNOK_0902200 [Pyrrhoderma noxium]